METYKRPEIRRCCEKCGTKLVFAKENDKVLITICPRCQCEYWFVRVNRDERR